MNRLSRRLVRTMRRWRRPARMWQMRRASSESGAENFVLRQRVFPNRRIRCRTGGGSGRVCCADRIKSPQSFVSILCACASTFRSRQSRRSTVGQSVSVTTSAWPDRNFSGRVARISPNVTPTSRTMTIEAEIENSSAVLKPGQFATVRILQERAEPAVLVPARAVRTEAGVSRVFVMKDGYARERIVQIGQTEGDLVEIRSGIAADETGGDQQSGDVE